LEEMICGSRLGGGELHQQRATVGAHARLGAGIQLL
jgi:hypothetical protein